MGKGFCESTQFIDANHYLSSFYIIKSFVNDHNQQVISTSAM